MLSLLCCKFDRRFVWFEKKLYFCKRKRDDSLFCSVNSELCQGLLDGSLWWGSFFALLTKDLFVVIYFNNGYLCNILATMPSDTEG